jgi:hypothetical protein
VNKCECQFQVRSTYFLIFWLPFVGKHNQHPWTSTLLDPTFFCFYVKTTNETRSLYFLTIKVWKNMKKAFLFSTKKLLGGLFWIFNVFYSVFYFQFHVNSMQLFRQMIFECKKWQIVFQQKWLWRPWRSIGWVCRRFSVTPDEKCISCLSKNVLFVNFLFFLFILEIF